MTGQGAVKAAAQSEKKGRKSALSGEKEDGKEPKDKFEELYCRYRTRMYWTAYSLLKDTYEAESIVQDAFVLLSGQMDRIEEVESARTCAYLKVIVEHLSINYLKRKKKILLLEEVHRESAREEKEDPGRRDEERALREALEELPYPYYQVLVLQYYLEYSGEEIAGILKKTPANIRQIAKRAREKLKKRMEEKGYGRE